MGRNAPRREMSYGQAALETYRMEIEHGVPHETALASAVECAVATANRAFTVGTRDDILEKAEDIDNDEGNGFQDDGPAALIFYAYLLDETLPPELRLNPAE